MEIIFELKEIENAVKRFLEIAGHYRVLAFSGDLGAGKTTFISALCKQAGVTEAITSPTFSIIQEYTTSNGKTIFHIDLYRIKDEEEAINTGIEDCLNSNEWCMVEWPEKALRIFPPDTVFTTIQILSKEKRKLMIQLP